jgi:hypothetical protein
MMRAVANAELGRWDQAMADQAKVGGPGAKLILLSSLRTAQQNGRDGHPLRILDRDYRRGLAHEGPSEVLVLLPRPGRRFTATAGIDAASTAGSDQGVTFVARIAGRQVYQSPEMRGHPAGQPVALDLGGASAFVIQVRCPNKPPQARADWADARVELQDGRTLWLGDLPVKALDGL